MFSFQLTVFVYPVYILIQRYSHSCFSEETGHVLHRQQLGTRSHTELLMKTPITIACFRH